MNKLFSIYAKMDHKTASWNKIDSVKKNTHTHEQNEMMKKKRTSIYSIIRFDMVQ